MFKFGKSHASGPESRNFSKDSCEIGFFMHNWLISLEELIGSS